MTSADPVPLLTELIGFGSVGGSPGEVAIQHRLAERLSDLGLTVDLWPLDLAELRAAADYPGEEVERAQAWGLVATKRPGETPELILQGHVDVVPPGDPAAWRSDPFRAVVDATDVTGRGSCDMLGGVACILAAAERALADGDEAPPFAVHFVVGEEDGGLGAYATLHRGRTGRACVIPEPTNLGLITANAGSLTFRIEVPGLATHGSTRYAGASAIDAYLPIHAALADLEASRNRDPEPLVAHLPIPYPLSVGKLRAGDWASSVPDRLVAEGRYGLRIDEDPEAARAEFADALAAATSLPVRLSWPGGTFRGGRLPSEHPLRDRVAAAHTAVTGSPPEPERGAPYGSDLRLYAAAGIPTLHYGPGDVRLAHGPNESVPIEQLHIATEVLTRLLTTAP